MRLHELLDDLPGRQSRQINPVLDPEVLGVSHDSRTVQAGDLFVAIPGARYDGRQFAEQAVSRGAVAVLGPGPIPVGTTVPWIVEEAPRTVLGPLAARVYGAPDRRLVLVGVTGTNGKSTVTALVAAMLEAAGRSTATLGTLGYRFRQHEIQGARTTPEASDLFRLLAAMHQEGAQAAVMEVSSHALSLGRVAGAHFDVAVFTNLSHDHLDFHGDLESYFAAKRELFAQRKPNGRAVVNVDDPFGRRLAAELSEVVSYGEAGMVHPHEVTCDLRGIHGTVSTPRGEIAINSRLLGRYNLENLLAAVAVAEALALPAAAIRDGIAAQGPIAGRMEPVDAGQSFPVLIDFAHTPAALKAALNAVRELSDRHVVLVFGCGGDRDKAKRPLMGEVAGRLAHLPVVTTDNPRSEEPLAIMSAVEGGLKRSGNPSYRLVPDRRVAIRRAIAVAGSDPGGGRGWAVLVAGKGHEEEQVFADRTVHFSDREEIEAALTARVWERHTDPPHEVRHG